MTALPLVQAENITVYFGDTIVFKEFSARVQPGEHLVLVGENGSGKSTLLKLFAGEIRLSQIPLEGLGTNGSILWNFDGNAETSALTAKEHVRLVSPGQQSAYIRQGWRITGEEIILSGLYNTPLLYASASEDEKREARRLAKQAGVTHLLSMPAPDMSQGQLRAMLILRAMAARPKLLLLDEPMEGLDATTRALLIQLMRLAAERGSTLLVTAHRREDIPQWITSICAIGPQGLRPIPRFPDHNAACKTQKNTPPETSGGNRLFDLLFPPLPDSENSSIAPSTCALSAEGPEAAAKTRARHPEPASESSLPYEASQSSEYSPAPESSPAPQAQPGRKGFSGPVHSDLKHSGPEHANLTNPGPVHSDPTHSGPMLSAPILSAPMFSAPMFSAPPKPPLVALDHVEVYIDRTLVLKDINWHINEGEHWLVLGENGSGKSTLLRLLHGEEFAAWGGSLRWFGQSSIPLTQLQKQVGYVSDRLHSLYTYNMTARDVVLSGADGSIGIYRDLSPQEHLRAEQLMDYFSITPFAHNLFHSLSSGQGRRVLLARALVGSPKVLLLDEPFSGLDSPNRALWLHTLTLLAERGVSIVFVSHHTDEHAPFFTHQLTLSKGRTVEKKALQHSSCA